MIKSILSHLTDSMPSGAIIIFRTLFEILHVIWIIIHNDYEFAKIYSAFDRYEYLDDIGDIEPEIKQKVNHFVSEHPKINLHYAWIHFIDDTLPLTFKSVLKLCGYEEGYKIYNDTSKFVHGNAWGVTQDQSVISNYLIKYINYCLVNLSIVFKNLVSDYHIKIEKEHLDDLESLNQNYEKAFEKFKENL
jgi:hypothetical protein